MWKPLSSIFRKALQPARDQHQQTSALPADIPPWDMPPLELAARDEAAAEAAADLPPARDACTEPYGPDYVTSAETAAYVEDADRTADRLLDTLLREMSLANTPLDVQYPDAGYGMHDFPGDHSRAAENRLAEHLRVHPELQNLPKWQAFGHVWDTHDTTAGDQNAVRDDIADFFDEL